MVSRKSGSSGKSGDGGEAGWFRKSKRRRGDPTGSPLRLYRKRDALFQGATPPRGCAAKGLCRQGLLSLKRSAAKGGESGPGRLTGHQNGSGQNGHGHQAQPQTHGGSVSGVGAVGAVIAGIAAAVGVGIGGTADGADLIAGVAGLGAGGVLGVFHHGAVTGGGQRLGRQYLIAVIADDGDRAVLGAGGRGLGAGGVVVIAGDLHGDKGADGVQLLRRGSRCGWCGRDRR